MDGLSSLVVALAVAAVSLGVGALGGTIGGMQAVVALLGGLAIGLGVGLANRVRFVQPLRALQQRFAEINRTGDLSARVSVGRGPLSGAVDDFNALMATFQAIIGKVVHDARRVADAADALAGHAGRVAEGSQHQRSASESMAGNIHEMNGGIRAVAEHAARTADNAQEARKLSQDGTRIVLQASGAIEQIAQAVEHSAAVVSTLGARSEEISGIVQVIREIADQTNLLALNAAIEAARAGEQGRGFAVVADEVRKLAERTSSATAEIGNMIASIQSETRSATDSIHKGSALARDGAGLARQAADSLGRIDSGAKETMEKVEGIVVAINQQSREADTVVDHVKAIMQMVEQNSAGASETLEEARRLKSLAANLQEINKVFRLGAEGERAMAIHKRMPDKVMAAAREAGRLLEQAIRSGQITEQALFERNYRPIPGTQPQKFETSFDRLTDQLMPGLQEPLLEADPDIILACLVDEKGYLPTHNRRYTQPLTGDPAKDLVGNRTKRIFDDPVGRQCGAHQLPYLVQTYRRDTGEVLHDISSPVYVNGRQWGGFRIGYKA